MGRPRFHPIRNTLAAITVAGAMILTRRRPGRRPRRGRKRGATTTATSNGMTPVGGCRTATTG